MKESKILIDEKTQIPLTSDEISWMIFQLKNGGIGNIPVSWLSKRNLDNIKTS